MARVEIVSIGAFSDGDSSHVPKSEWRLVDPPTIYLEKIGSLWMEKQKLTRPGARYYLDKLPDGYRLYERPRPGNSKIVDKHLYGHPKHKFFDSPNRFFPHFEHLMNYATTDDCPCTICGAKTAKPLPVGRSATKTKPAGRPPRLQIPQNVDDESVPDTIRELLNRLQREGPIDQPIEEIFSMDWRAQKDILNSSLDQLTKQKLWLPRIGELVLFMKYLPTGSEVCLDTATEEFKVWTEEDGVGHFGAHPMWEAGVIGQIPEENVKLQDVIQETEKTNAIANSGYRVEPLPNPNSEDKSLTLQYKYVPLHHIRPFVFWKEYLKGIPESELHPSILNSTTVMSSVAIVNRYRLKGTWPSATIYCQGAYLGSELIKIGDTVRLLPTEGSQVEDILQVESIKLSLSNLDKASDNDYDQGHPYNARLHMVGKAFTVNRKRGWTTNDIIAAMPSIEGYGQWYHLHDPTKHLQVNFTRVLGRCFEAEPMLLWFPSASEEVNKLLTYGLTGTQHARTYSSQHDRRILPGKTWFWADSRAEALDIPSLNNIDTSYYDATRDEEKLDDWHKATKVMERTASSAEKLALRNKVLEQDLLGAKVGLGTRLSTVQTLDAIAERHSTTPKTDPASRSQSRASSAPRTQPSTVVVQIPASNLKRAYSTATSQDELDQDRSEYHLDEWVKSVASVTSPHRPLTATSSTVRSPGMRPLASVTPKAPESIVRRIQVNNGATLPDDDSSSASGSPFDALAAFKRQKTGVAVD